MCIIHIRYHPMSIWTPPIEKKTILICFEMKDKRYNLSYKNLNKLKNCIAKQVKKTYESFQITFFNTFLRQLSLFI